MKEILVKMKVFVVIEFKKWSVKEVDVFKFKYKEVLIEMEILGICYIDLYAVNYDWLVELKYLLILGYEGIGKVVVLGEGCICLKIGDRVVLVWLYDVCGYCEYCLIGREIFCLN